MKKISLREHQMLQQALQAGEHMGYGNVIAHLQTAWARYLMEEYQMDEETARTASGGPGYPFAMHEDLVKRACWDETGEKYR